MWKDKFGRFEKILYPYIPVTSLFARVYYAGSIHGIVQYLYQERKLRYINKRTGHKSGPKPVKEQEIDQTALLSSLEGILHFWVFKHGIVFVSCKFTYTWTMKVSLFLEASADFLLAICIYIFLRN